MANKPKIWKATNKRTQSVAFLDEDEYKSYTTAHFTELKYTYEKLPEQKEPIEAKKSQPTPPADTQAKG